MQIIDFDCSLFAKIRTLWKCKTFYKHILEFNKLLSHVGFSSPAGIKYVVNKPPIGFQPNHCFN